MIRSRFIGTILRLKDVIRFFPLRIRRIGLHFKHICPYRLWWWIELACLLLDLFGLPELYETVADWTKWSTRPLTTIERELLLPLFGHSIDYDRIRIDEKAYLGPPQWRICYVSFYTINNWGSMTNALLIHEMVHVWQFMQVGSLYIPRALRAQRSPAGYNYGGPIAVHRAVATGFRLLDFNYEQQGDLVADYWRLQNGKSVQWGPAGAADLAAYAALVEDLRRE